MVTVPSDTGPHHFSLIHSNALDVLAGVLAERLRVPADGDWLRPEMVLVPQFSMRRWLQQALAERTGICANVRFLTPGEFVDIALDANLGAAGRGDRLRPESLRWSLLHGLRSAPPPAWREFLMVDGTPGERDRKAWSLACALAATFEKYQAWRRDLLLRWEAGAEPDDPQAQLWRQVAAGRAHRARRIGEYLARFGADAAHAPTGLPRRLSVFACQNVSPDVLQLVASQSRAGVQEFYLHTPSRAYWGDLGRWARDYVPADDDAAFAGTSATGNPLLAAWGRAERDFVATLGGGEAVHAHHETPAFVEPSRATLLGRLQADVLDNMESAPAATVAEVAVEAAPVGVAMAASDPADRGHGRSHEHSFPKSTVDRGDASLQFHACHTRLREVQVLHDQLRALLEADAPAGGARLQPREIAVLAPDIDLYAPHIEAVFGGALGTSRELPYTIADTSPLASEAMADAFARLLDLPLRAPSLADVLDLVAVPAVAARFGIDDAMRGSLQTWLQAAGARRGFDAADPGREGDGDAYTFAFALDRLLLGYASGDDTDIAGVAPWPELEGQSALALDALLQVIARLRDATRDLAGPHAPREWAARLERLLVALFGDDPRDPRDARTLARLRQAVAAFAEGAGEAGFEATVEHAIVRDQLLADLRDADARAPFLSGGICFGRMVPMRLIPFQAICLLGMDDGAFPGHDARDPLNRIVQALATDERRVGDPARRDADRYLFLQLFSSAARTFYLSWQGFDARDGSERAPASVVAELLDVAVRQHAGDGDDVRHALVVRHALQPFSPAAFGAAHVDEREGDPRRFSFDARWRIPETPLAQALPVFAVPTANAARDNDAAAGEIIGLDALRRALVQPQALYLREGLGLRLPEDEPPLDEHEPFGAPDALGMHGLRARVFEAWLREGARPATAALHTHLLARAQVAPGADGRATLARVLDAIEPFAALALARGFAGAGETLSVDIPLDGARVVGRLRGVYPQGVLRVALRDGGVHGGHALRHRLDALVASLLGLTVHQLQDGEKKDEPPELDALLRMPVDTARAALQSLVALQRRMRHAPLPFLPKSGFALWIADDADAGMRAARNQWLGSDYVHAESDASTQLALRGRDPFVDGDVAARAAFTAASHAVFAALTLGTPFDAREVLP